MCGIVGFTVLEHDDRYMTFSRLHRMTGSIYHRGPNAEGIYADDQLALGSRRLSLVDITNGSQPFYNENRSVITIYNGEIYNAPSLRHKLLDKGHELHSYCDGEIIPHLYEEYGAAFVSLLDGMFAIALWDTASRRLILSVDQAGIKPLYYTWRDGRLLFASELKAIQSADGTRPSLNLTALMTYLKYKFIPAPDTPFLNIHKMRPGQMLTWEYPTLASHYYECEEIEPEHTDLSDLLHAAVMTTTMSDKRVGCLLSGGLDSSIVVSSLAREMPGAPIFSVGYPGDLDADETVYSERLCRELGLHLHRVCIGPRDIPDHLDSVVWHLDEPNQDPITIPYYLLLKQVKDSVSVVLTGDGSDEFFGGYKRFAAWDSEYASGLSAYEDELFLFRLQELRKDFVDAHRDSFARQEPERDFANICSLRQCMAWEQRYRLPAYHLNRVDKLSMAWGVESRVPFLRAAVTQYAQRLETSELRTAHIEKIRLKESFRDKLPDWLLDRKKQPFTFPVSHWLRSELQGWSRELLVHSASPVHEFIEPSYIASLIDQHCAAQSDHGYKIWALLVLDSYLKQS